MKKILFIVLAVVFYMGCDEIGPNINLTDEIVVGSGNPSGEVKRVVVEEFTGVRCVNCPAGSDKIKDLLNNHGDNLIAISYHAGFFANPYPESQYDFRTPEGTNIEANIIGPVSGYPAASVNRKLFANELELPVGLNKWAGYINQELQLVPKLTIDIASTYDDGNRELVASVDMNFLSTVTESLKLTILITEDGVEDTQLTPSGKQNNYVHKHIFRTTLTNSAGDPITDPTTANATITKGYNYTLPSEWNADNCHVIAFVHPVGVSKDILQANQVDLK